MRPNLLKAALWYARHGLHVFPCMPRDKNPAISKRRGGRGCHDATADATTIGKWWSQAEYNIGIECGRSGLLVVDVDGGKSGWDSLRDLERKHGELPVTPEVVTASGAHFYFKAPATETRNSVSSKLGTGIDTRAAGGYVLGPPSVHPSGHVYTWAEGRGIHQVALAPLPEWIAERLRPPPEPERKPVVIEFRGSDRGNYGRKALRDECDDVIKAGKGARNNALNIAALKIGQIVGAGLLDERIARGALIQAGINAGLGARESLLTVNSGMSAGMRQPREVQERHG